MIVSSWKHARRGESLYEGKIQAVVVVMVKVMMMIRQERCGPALGSQIATGWSEGRSPSQVEIQSARAQRNQTGGVRTVEVEGGRKEEK